MANGESDLLVRLRDFLVLLTTNFLRGYPLVIAIIAAIFFLLVGALLLFFR